MSCVMRNQSSGFPARYDMNQAVQPWKMARGLKFWVSEKRDCITYVAKTKVLISIADLLLCFRICKMQVFS